MDAADVMDENEQAHLDGLRTAALGLIALMGLFFSTRVPPSSHVWRTRI